MIVMLLLLGKKSLGPVLFILGLQQTYKLHVHFVVIKEGGYANISPQTYIALKKGVYSDFVRF